MPSRGPSLASPHLEIRRLDGRGSPATARVDLYLRELLFDGELRPGDQIDQDAVAEALGVSRQPVREAVLDLASDGLLVIRPRKGVFVGRFDAKVVRGHYELNGYIEAFAASKVALDPQPAVVATLRSLLAAMRRERDPIAIEEASLDFYWTINLASDNPRIGDALRVLQRFVPSPVYARYPALVGIGRRGAAKVLAAIEAADTEAARRACVDQWTAAGDVVVADLMRRGIIAG